MEKVFLIKDYKKKIILKNYLNEEEKELKSYFFNEMEIKKINNILKNMECRLLKRNNYLELMQKCKLEKIHISYKDAKDILNYNKIKKELSLKSYHAFLKLKDF